MRVLAVLLDLAVFRGVKWKAESDHSEQSPVQPFRIDINLYYVFTQNVTSCMLTGPEGPA